MSTPERVRRRWRWPRTLYGRLVLVLVGGMLLAQALTGTIWFDVRYDQVNEVPARVAGTELGLWLAGLDPADDGAQGRTVRDGFEVRRIEAPAARTGSFRDAGIERALAGAVGAQSRGVGALHLQEVALYDDQGRASTTRAVFGAREPQVRYRVHVADAWGRWWAASIRTGQAGMTLQSPRATLDYLARLYGLRMGLILLLSLLVVHWLVRPLARLAAAAEALGRDVNSPPLAVEGPREVRRAADAFNRMQARLLDAFASREQLLAAVSHDLRSPLTRLRLRTGRIPDAAMRERFEDDIRQMDAITGSILDYFQARAEDAAPDALDLDALMTAIAADLAETGADVRIAGQLGVSVPAWPASLRRAMTNLIENAVRYGARARVDVTLHGRCARITIDDDGPGIAEARIAHVCRPFVRLDGARSHDGGIGMGLSIAEAVIQAHGGTLTLANRSDDAGVVTGLRVTVELPLVRSG